MTGSFLIARALAAFWKMPRELVRRCALFDKLTPESRSSSLSSLVNLASLGIAADSNGLFTASRAHAENFFSVDGQPITDQVSKVFSNQLPADSVQSRALRKGAGRRAATNMRWFDTLSAMGKGSTKGLRAGESGFSFLKVTFSRPGSLVTRCSPLKERRSRPEALAQRVALARLADPAAEKSLR